jgi:hypothetical protein
MDIFIHHAMLKNIQISGMLAKLIKQAYYLINV